MAEGLRVERRDYSLNPWRVVIDGGYYDGVEVGVGHPTKREAVQAADERQSPLWPLMVPVPETDDWFRTRSAPVVVNAYHLAELRADVARAQWQATVYHRALLGVDGSMMMVERARAELEAEAAAADP